MKRLTLFFDATFWRFVLVGLANTLVGNGLSFLLLNLHVLPYWPASAVSYLLASVMSYFLNKHFTFRNTESGWRPAVRFGATIAVCWATAYGVAKPVVAWLLSGATPLARDNVAMATGMVLFVTLNYLGQRLIVFADRPEKTE